MLGVLFTPDQSATRIEAPPAEGAPTPRLGPQCAVFAPHLCLKTTPEQVLERVALPQAEGWRGPAIEPPPPCPVEIS